MEFSYEQAAAFWAVLVGSEAVNENGDSCGRLSSPAAYAAMSSLLGYYSLPTQGDFGRLQTVLTGPPREPYPHEKKCIEQVGVAGDFLTAMGRAMKQAEVNAMGHGSV